jgi:hypothetical protein
MDPRVVADAEACLAQVEKTYAPLIEGHGLDSRTAMLAVLSMMGERGWIRKRRRLDGDPLPTDEEIEAIKSDGATA